MSHPILSLINQGEHQQLDFKFEISDSRKIARTLVAFSNTDGGKLLIGVKDNGNIAGVRSDEEFYMVQAAAEMYCRPKIEFTTREWEINGKMVLEVTIPRRNDGPFSAQDEHGKWLIYIRVQDQNILANKIWIKVWKRRKAQQATWVRYTDAEKSLLQYLEQHPRITMSGFLKLAGLPKYKAETVLVNLICLNILDMTINDKGVWYHLKPGYDRNPETRALKHGDELSFA
ncbi:MAG TPA: ATP-binding protein [Bacteroidales bacterium]|nr:putative DNA binding domain-containing protein [Lentimicrobiaceae bacterium]HOH99965.1 ATP-binding protein [Bacteroidales bacterium]